MSERYQILDALRGLSLILMLAYHFGFALLSFGMISEEILFNPLLNVLQPVFAGVFIILCGISSRFSRNNIKRGLTTLSLGAAITAVTWFAGVTVWFGILQLLGTCMLICGLFGRRMPSSRSFLVPCVLFSLFIICFTLFPVQENNDYLAWLGIATKDFFKKTADYFPLGKWFFLFLTGITPKN
jgi:uncharacterized membrane protein